MKKGGRVVNLSSVGSTLDDDYGEDVKRELRDEKLTMGRLEAMAKNWEVCFR